MSEKISKKKIAEKKPVANFKVNALLSIFEWIIWKNDANWFDFLIFRFNEICSQSKFFDDLKTIRNEITIKFVYNGCKRCLHNYSSFFFLFSPAFCLCLCFAQSSYDSREVNKKNISCGIFHVVRSIVCITMCMHHSVHIQLRLDLCVALNWKFNS